MGHKGDKDTYDACIVAAVVGKKACLSQTYKQC